MTSDSCNSILSVYVFTFSPPVNPPKEITDPEDKKPSDWDDKERYLFDVIISALSK